MTTDRPNLSPFARRLLDVLSSCCRRRDAAMPDRWLAGEIGCSVREVIDLADDPTIRRFAAKVVQAYRAIGDQE